MGFETEQFIIEIHNRPCIWNVYMEEYGNRTLRQRAWDQIGESLCNDWTELDAQDRLKRIQDLQKKWKGLRDYFNRKKNSSSSNSPSRKKRKSRLLDMLNFLNGMTTASATSENIGEAKETPGTESEDSQSSLTSKRNITTMSIFPNQDRPPSKHDADMSFLLTILPEMRTMSARENFDFRFGVMKLIKEMKYSQPENSVAYAPGTARPRYDMSDSSAYRRQVPILNEYTHVVVKKSPSSNRSQSSDDGV